jgi:hypothetical protein
MRVDRRGRGQADGLADVADRGRVAVIGRVALDEVEDLALPLGEVELDHQAPPFGLSFFAEANMCSLP